MKTLDAIDESFSSTMRHYLWVMLLAALFLAGMTTAAQAQAYSIDWSSIDGGGGTSTGGVFSITGTIGQPDAGAMSGGNFTLTGGFWSIAAVQNPPAPYLSVLRTATNTVLVSWPGPEAGWKLQATTNLLAMPVVWTEIAPPYQTSGTDLCYVEPLPLGNKFYRLHKP